ERILERREPGGTIERVPVTFDAPFAAYFRLASGGVVIAAEPTERALDAAQRATAIDRNRGRAHPFTLVHGDELPPGPPGPRRDAGGCEQIAGFRGTPRWSDVIARQRAQLGVPIEACDRAWFEPLRARRAEDGGEVDARTDLLETLARERGSVTLLVGD